MKLRHTELGAAGKRESVGYAGVHQPDLEAQRLDLALVQQVLDGRREALTELYERHYTGVFRYLVAHLGDRQAAEDGTQDVFLKMIDKLHTFRGGSGSFTGWLFRIARNTLTDYYRSRQRRADLVQAETQRLEVQGDGEADVDDNLTLLEVGKLVQSLPPAQREVVMLRFAAGLSIKETSTALGKAEGTVKALQFQALQSLRKRSGQ